MQNLLTGHPLLLRRPLTPAVPKLGRRAARTYSNGQVSPVDFCGHDVVVLPILQCVVVWILWDSAPTAEREERFLR